MDLGLKGQTAVVFGAVRGIGRAIVEAFAGEGASVILVDRDSAVEQAGVEVAKKSGVKASVHVADVGEYADCVRVAEGVLASYGRVNHVVFAVGIGSGKFGFPFWNLTPADWPKVLHVNLLGAVHVAHACAESLRQSAGTLTLISSVSGQIGSQTDPPYSASKAALINFAQCAAKDFAPYGVRVNTVCPGMVKTALNQSIWEAWNKQQPPEKQRSYEDWAGEKVAKVVPLGRWQDPEDVARMVVFVASACGKNITGQTINVDGGFVMHW